MMMINDLKYKSLAIRNNEKLIEKTPQELEVDKLKQLYAKLNQ